jgi:hypothetical protein
MDWSTADGIRRNNFDFLRLLLAVTAIDSHGFLISHGPTAPDRFAKALRTPHSLRRPQQFRRMLRREVRRNSWLRVEPTSLVWRRCGEDVLPSIADISRRIV